MVYRIDWKHFLLHAIDHFSRDDLVHMNYVIVSAKIRNTGTMSTVVRLNDLYPTNEIIVNYSENHSRDYLKRAMFGLYDQIAEDVPKTFYDVFINTLIAHIDVMIVCAKVQDDFENQYVDVLCEYLKKRYGIDVIDLNKLFTDGCVGPIYLDRDEVWNKAVDIRRAAGHDMIKSYESSQDGREYLLRKMSKKDKLCKLKELGIHVTKGDLSKLDELLMDAWVKDESGS